MTQPSNAGKRGTATLPISKEMAKRYPTDWNRRRRFIIEYRAGNRCEWCGARNKEPHPETGKEVLITLAHVWDKRPEQASLLNLAALCGLCHNRWDAKDRAVSRFRQRVARRLRAGQLPLPWPADVSVAMELYLALVQGGQIMPPSPQIPIPPTAYEKVA